MYVPIMDFSTQQNIDKPMHSIDTSLHFVWDRGSYSVRSLGVIFDCNLRMEQQIANIVKVCYYQIRNIGRIRPHLTNESCKIFVHALVTSRLFNCVPICLIVSSCF